ncbi:MAG: hypothetical protein ABH872_06435 [Candidatus Omnitrophota bacterium]
MTEQATMEKEQQANVKEEQPSGQNTKATFKIAAGLGFIIVGLAALIGFWDNFWAVISGCIGPIFILAGIITIAIARD